MDDSVLNYSPPKTQYDDMRDNDFRHLENPEADDLRATQNIMRTKARAEERLGDNLVAHNGILENITCINFMCHERLNVDLGPLLNFIVGENGSGKSAILTAITLCLGGKASATNRGGSLKSFIKEGCDRASLSITLKNQGDDAYRPDLYGDSIVVERSFSKTGASGFKVKSAEGQVISTKKAEVDEIVEFYALQVDNPLNILSQDNARQFLNASTPAQKYKYFIEGVQLEQLDRDYRLISEFVEQSEAKQPLQREKMEAAQKDYREALRLEKLANDNKGLRAKQRLLRNQVIWSQVAGEERKAVEMDQRLAAMDEDIAGFEQVIEELAAKMEQHDTMISEKRATLEIAKEEDSQREAGVEALKSSYAEASKTLVQIHNDERNAHTEAKSAKEQVKRLEKKIAAERAKLEALQGDEVIRQRESLENAKTRRDELKEQVEDIRRQVKDDNEKCKASQERVKTAKVALDEKKTAIQETKNHIRQLQAGQGGKYDAYDRKIPNLIRAIEQDNGFNEKPIGPIGAHIQLLDPKWSSILEKTLGNLLNDFIVTNLADQKRLQKHMSSIGLNAPSIIISNSRRIDTTNHEPDAQFDTVLRILKFDNDVVRSQLIIGASVEQIILIPDRVKAEAVMFPGNGIGPPRNIKQCFSIHDTKRDQGLLLKNANGGRNLGTHPIVTNRNQRPRMKADQGSLVSAQQELLRFLEQEYRGLEEQCQQVQRELRLNTDEVTQKNKRRVTLEGQVKGLEKEMEAISRHLDGFEGADAQLEMFLKELDTQKESAEHFGNQYGDIALKKESQSKECEVRKEALAAEREQKRAYEKKVVEAENEVKKWENLRNICLAEKNAAHEQLDIAKDERRRRQQKRQEQDQQIEAFTKQALLKAPERVHIPDGESHESLSAQFSSLTTQLRELQRQNGISDKEAYELVRKTKKISQKVSQDYEVAVTTVKRLRETLNQRLTKWRLLQRLISAHARCSFSILLRERRFRGKLMINHREKQLSLRVEPEKTEKSGSGRSTKTLSGGEKSFSSICLLLSIWESMGAPLRCLDEFDVFMDNVNRAVSTKMLVSELPSRVARIRRPQLDTNHICPCR